MSDKVMKSISILLVAVAVVAGAEASRPTTFTVRTSKGDVVIENVLAGANGGGGLHKLPEGGEFEAAPQIVGGSVVNKIKRFPQVVVIIAEDKKGRVRPFCSGVIIDKKVVMSAAQCFNNLDKQLTYYACSGTVDINRDTKRSKCGEILSVLVPRISCKVLCAYSENAILKLSRKITGSHAKRVKVSFAKPENGLKGFSVGFGTNKSGAKADGKMRSAAAKVVLKEGQCKALNRLGWKNDSRFICAKSNNSGACFGDSGGPLLIETKKKNDYICVGVVRMFACKKGTESIYSSLYQRVQAWLFRAAVKAAKGTYRTGKLPKK